MKCFACNGSGYYDQQPQHTCASCGGTGNARKRDGVTAQQPNAIQVQALVRAADFIRQTGRPVGSGSGEIGEGGIDSGAFIGISRQTFNELLQALDGLPDKGKQP